MNNIELIICDPDIEYSRKLIAYLRGQTDNKYSVRFFKDSVALMEESPLGDVLLIDEDIYEGLKDYFKEHIVANEIFTLCGRRRDVYPKGYIYKFQSAKLIINEITNSSASAGEGTTNGDVILRDRRIRVKEDVLRRLSRKSEESEEEIHRVIDECVDRENRLFPMDTKDQEMLRRELFHAIKGYDVLQDLIEDDSITEIMVNGPEHIFIEREGRLYETDRKFESKELLQDIIGKIVGKVNRSVNLASPIVDARLPDGSRVNVVLDPVAINGPIMTIRRFGERGIEGEDLIRLGSINAECLEYLGKLVRAGYNILISGGTGAGKTTFLNVMSSFIPGEERIITIEDSAELQLKDVDNLVRFEARSKTGEGVTAITIRDLIKTSLRSRPDRVIVGEVRSEEAIDMLQALNIGLDGSMSTIHANSARDALNRLETIVMLTTDIPILALRRQIASGIDIIVHLGRLRDKSRRVLEVIEILGVEGSEIQTQKLFEFEEIGESFNKVIGELKKTADLVHREKLKRAGISI